MSINVLRAQHRSQAQTLFAEIGTDIALLGGYLEGEFIDENRGVLSTQAAAAGA